MRGLLLVGALMAPGCPDLLTGTGVDAGGGKGSTADAGASSDASASADGGVGSSGGHGATSGTNCATDQVSGITLCEGIAQCPGLTVDQGAFPGCGFRMNAPSTYDLECACGDVLCPIGAATSCTDAVQLLDQAQSSLNVCQEANAGTCMPLSGGGGGSQSTCDKACESECAGDPNCIQMCGC
jgi:hypothetical protein